MKSTLSLTIAFACLLTSPFIHAQEEGATAEVSFASKYVFRGIQYGDDTWHPSVEFYNQNLYLGAWAALPLESRGYPDYFDEEYDFYGGYGWAIDDKTALDVGGTYYNHPNRDDSLEAYVGVSHEMGTATPSLYIYRDFDLDTFTFQFSTDIVSPLPKAPFELSAFVGYVSTDSGTIGAGTIGTDYTYYGADLVYPIKLSERTRLSLGVHYSDHDLKRGVEGDHLFGSAAFTASF